MARRARRIYHDLDKRTADRRVGAGGNAAPERAVRERRIALSEERERPHPVLIGAILLIAAILIDNYVYHGQYRHHLVDEFDGISTSLRTWSNGLWGA
jgi:hypothetical protein